VEEPLLKRGNLIIVKTILIDHLCVVQCQQGDTVIVRKLDGRVGEETKIPLKDTIKLADEQERMLPSDLVSAVEAQRQLTFQPAKKKVPPKKSMDKLLRGMKKESMDAILEAIAQAAREGEEEGKEEENAIDTGNDSEASE
jgi:hypothetical protein